MCMRQVFSPPLIVDYIEDDAYSSKVVVIINID
jgi:hypothetical protein